MILLEFSVCLCEMILLFMIRWVEGWVSVLVWLFCVISYVISLVVVLVGVLMIFLAVFMCLCRVVKYLMVIDMFCFL